MIYGTSELSERLIRFEKELECAVLLNLTIIQQPYGISLSNCGEPVRDEYECLLPSQSINSLHHCVLRPTIKGTCSLIHYQDLRVLVECPCNPNPLPLSST